MAPCFQAGCLPCRATEFSASTAVLDSLGCWRKSKAKGARGFGASKGFQAGGSLQAAVK